MWFSLFYRRILSYAVDYVMFIILGYVLRDIGVWGYLLCYVILFLYRYILTSKYGETLGMKLFKLKLLNYDFRICLKREIIRFASSYYFLGYIYGLFNRELKTLHDEISKTKVVHSENKSPAGYEENETENRKIINKIIPKAAYILLLISSLKWSSNMLLNEFGLFGLKRIYSSDPYYISFEGDNLTSLSQNELYMKTMGRNYTSIININGKPELVRVSNKLKYTEVYRLYIFEEKLTGEYLFKIDTPLQYITSGNMVGSRGLIALSPENILFIINDRGEIIAKKDVNIKNPISLKAGDIDNDGIDEAVILGRGGDVEILKFIDKNINESIKTMYSGKLGEDIIPLCFYIDRGLFVFSKGDDESIIYNYNFEEGRIKLNRKYHTKIKDVSNAEKSRDGFFALNIYRNSMAFRIGEIQRFEEYSLKSSLVIKPNSKEPMAVILHNFGNRPGRKYAYLVRSFEGFYDIDGDGEEEIILKAVGKDDVMGQGYIIEIYKRNIFIKLNRLLTMLEKILP